MKLERLNQEFPKMPEEMRVMIEKEVEKQTKEGEMLRYRKRKHFAGKALAVSAAIAMLLGTTVFAGVLYQMHSKKTGKYEVKTEIEGGGETIPDTQETETLPDIPEVKMEVSYLPEGMVETEKGKYSYQDSLYTGGVSIAFYRMDTGDGQFEMLTQNVISSEDIQVGGYDGVCLKTQSVAGEDVLAGHHIYVAYTDVHYVMEMYAASDVPEEEALKIAEGIRLVPAKEGEDMVHAYDWSEYLAALQEEEGTEDILEVNTAVDISEMKNTHKIGETFPVTGITASGEIAVRVAGVQVSDNVSLLEQSVMREDTKKNLAKETDAEGNLLPATISYIKYGDGVDTIDEIVDTREVPQKLVFVTVEYTNTTDRELTDVMFNGGMMKIAECNGQAVIYDGEEPKEEDGWDAAVIEGEAGFREMWYYDVHGGERGNNYIPSIKPQETATVHMAWLVPEQDLKYLYLNLNNGGGVYEFNEDSLQMGYVDIRQ